MGCREDGGRGWESEADGDLGMEEGVGKEGREDVVGSRKKREGERECSNQTKRERSERGG